VGCWRWDGARQWVDQGGVSRALNACYNARGATVPTESCGFEGLSDSVQRTLWTDLCSTVDLARTVYKRLAAIAHACAHNSFAA
jgi:hypothetical protein